eukprot:403352757
MQTFAMKVYNQNKSEMMAKDLVEFKIMSQIKSKYLCQVNDSFISESEQKLCIVYEYAKYGDLVKFCNKHFDKTMIPEDLLKQWLAQTALGLKELHSRNILHRDIKPQNILVFDFDDVKIADYGLAKFVNQDSPLNQSVVGTEQFMSIEMQKKQPYEFSTDIFSLGLTFIYLMTKKVTNRSKDGNYVFPKITGYSRSFISLILSMVNIRMELRPAVDDILNDPLIADTKAIKEFRQFLSICNYNMEDATFKQFQDTAKFSPNQFLLEPAQELKKEHEPINNQIEENKIQQSTNINTIEQIERSNNLPFVKATRIFQLKNKKYRSQSQNKTMSPNVQQTRKLIFENKAKSEAFQNTSRKNEELINRQQTSLFNNEIMLNNNLNVTKKIGECSKENDMQHRELLQQAEKQQVNQESYQKFNQTKEILDSIINENIINVIKVENPHQTKVIQTNTNLTSNVVPQSTFRNQSPILKEPYIQNVGFEMKDKTQLQDQQIINGNRKMEINNMTITLKQQQKIILENCNKQTYTFQILSVINPHQLDGMKKLKSVTTQIRQENFIMLEI